MILTATRTTLIGTDKSVARELKRKFDQSGNTYLNLQYCDKCEIVCDYMGRRLMKRRLFVRLVGSVKPDVRVRP